MKARLPVRYIGGRLVSALLVSTLLAGPTLAEPLQAEQRPHVHGQASLDLVAEGNVLRLELELPAIDVLGFEHGPRDQVERQALAQAVERIMNAEQMLVINPEAGCRLRNAKLDSSLLRQGPDTAATGQDGHADFEASYSFDCSQMAALRTLDVRLFQYFPTLLGLDVQMVVQGRQQGLALTPEASRLEF